MEEERIYPLEGKQVSPLKCSGCGVMLQTEDAARAGYAPEQALQRTPVLCQRCFRIRNYNDISSSTNHWDDYIKIVSHVGDTDSLVVNIVDIFDFEGSMISGLARIVGKNPIILVVNKMDLLPKVSNSGKILNWVRKQTKEHGLKVVEIVLCSAQKNIGFEKMIAALEEHRKGKDVYVVGATNVGKSTLINRLIRDYSNLDGELTTSRYPGTTLDLVNIPLNDGKYIVDTPGIVYSSRMTEIIHTMDLPAIVPDKPLKPIVFQLNEGQTLFLGALARFDFVKGERKSFTCFVANSLKVHRTKLDKAGEIYAEHKGAMLSPPSKEYMDGLPPLGKHSIKLPKGGHKDIFISGLGWIKANSDAGAMVEVFAPKGIKVIVRDSLI